MNDNPKSIDPLLDKSIDTTMVLCVTLFAIKQEWEKVYKVYQAKGYVGNPNRMIHLAEGLPALLQDANDKVNEYYYSMLHQLKPIMKGDKR